MTHSSSRRGRPDVDLACRIVELLEELIALDRDAVTELCSTRVPCNASLGDHPTVQVMQRDGQDYVGLIGILNGLVGTDAEGWGLVAVEVEDDGPVERARLLSERVDVEQLVEETEVADLRLRVREYERLLREALKTAQLDAPLARQIELILPGDPMSGSGGDG